MWSEILISDDEQELYTQKKPVRKNIQKKNRNEPAESVLLSDEESIPEKITRTRLQRNVKNNKKINYNLSITTISDDEDNIPNLKDVQKSAKMGVQVESVISDDEDFLPESSKVKTSRRPVKRKIYNGSDKTIKANTSKSCSSYDQNEFLDINGPKKKRVKKVLEQNEINTNSVTKESDCIPKQNRQKKLIKEETDEVDFEFNSFTNDFDEFPKQKRQKKPLKREIKSNIKNDDAVPKQNRQRKIKSEQSIEEDTVFNHKKLKTEIKFENNETLWKDHELLADTMNLSPYTSKNIIKFLLDGNTIPFLARYRREAIGNLPPETLREVKCAFEEICHLKEKIKTVISTVEKTGKLNKPLEIAIKSAKTVEELDIIYTPFKPEAKRTLAERAKLLGLEQPAIELLNRSDVNLNNYINPSKEELSSITNVKKGIVHIIAHNIATNSDVLAFLRDIRKKANFTIETKKLQAKKALKTEKPKLIGQKLVDDNKFQNYFDYKNIVKNIKPHQVLAINRGESQKVLSVKIVIPDFVHKQFQQFCYGKWGYSHNDDLDRKEILEMAVQDSYNRLVQPLITREIRSELKQMAEKASYDVFSKNLKHLLLAAPIKGQPILGIDPGFSHGCKLAVISSTGTVLDHCVIYPFSDNHKTAREFLKQMLTEHKCSLIALGDGTASNEMQEWLTQLIHSKYFSPLDVKYTIVSEDGASIYSCSPEAKKEFGDAEINIISAVSLARRVQDPMAELVKVEPRHLGIGMYQHDLKKKVLEEALDEVVSECVSFVGVDLNTSSQALLRRIAGLSDKRASEIIRYRNENGVFISRQELMKVTGIGPKVFQQCAGFLRVGPTFSSSSEAFYNKPKTSKLDQTIIHPESYDLTHKLLSLFNLNVRNIGENEFINKINAQKNNITDICKQLGASKETIELIFDALAKPLNYDLRTEISESAFFCYGLKNIDDLEIGTTVIGRVKNVTHFGCFVDIGVGREALIHCSKLKNIDLQVGNRVEGIVCSLDKQRMRINVQPVAKL